MADIRSIAEALINKTAEEVQNLAKVLKDEYGITAEKKEVSEHKTLVDGHQKVLKRLKEKNGNCKICM